MDSLETLSSPYQSADALAGFDYAVVRIAVVVPPQPKSDQTERPPLRLIFGSVSLLPLGRQIPQKRYDTAFKRFKKEKYSIAVDRVVMRAEDALNWYRSSFGTFTTPIPFENKNASDGAPLDVAALSDFPKWPILGVPMQSESLTDSSEQSPVPFQNIGITRYSRRISGTQSWPDFLNPSGRTKNSDDAFNFLLRHLHVDLRDYPEYLGGITLAVPDIDVASVRQFIDPKNGDSESLYFHLKPHLGRPLQNLNLTVFEGQEGMLTAFQTLKVPEDGLIEIIRLNSIDTAGLVLAHEQRGVLLQTPMKSFLRQMHFTMEVVEQRVKVTVPETESKNSAENHYHTEKKTLASAQTYGSPADTSDAFKRLTEARNDRSLNYSALRYDQTWFGTGQRILALDYIRTKIRNARASVFIVDPYFAATQIAQFLFALERSDIKLKILTSKSAFAKSKKTADGKTAEVTSEEKLADFKSTLDSFKSLHANPLEVRIAETSETSFHDRFIAIDGRVWILGSSLNSIGTQPTLIMRVPHGDKVIDLLGQLFDNSAILEGFSEQGEFDA